MSAETAIVLDTETTGTQEGYEPVEVAWVRVNLYLKELQSFESRYKPSKPITLGAKSVHHITEDDLTKCDPPSAFRFPPTEYLIGHNIDYDWTAIGKPNVKRICTLALCRKLWPDADSHTLGAMIYLHRPPEASWMLKNSHSAICDVRNTVRILHHILDKLGSPKSWEEVWKASEAARIPTVMPFGKHKGTAIKDIPPDYRRWLLGQSDVDPYLVQALRGGR